MPALQAHHSWSMGERIEMDYFDLIKARRSIRSFTTQPVEPSKLGQILEAANSAPSAGNLQAYEIYLVTAEQTRHALGRASNQDFIAVAPVILAFCTNPAQNEWRYAQRGTQLYTVQDATIACTYAMLAATALGLATVWIGAFDDKSVRQILAAPAQQLPVAMLPVGYPAEQPERRGRRSLDELVHKIG